MEREMGQPGVDTISCSSPPFFQHQFFPGAGGMQPTHSNNTEHMHGHLSPTTWDHNALQQGAHWDMKAWRYDNARFVAERAAEEGGNSCEGGRNDIRNENGETQRVSEFSFQLDRSLDPEEHGNYNEGDEPEQRGRSFLRRETPSPLLNDGQSLPRNGDSLEEAGALSLKLGGESYAYAEDNGIGSRNGKRNRSLSPQSQVPTCQVDGCKADLSRAKDYHRRHKVCEVHSKAGKAPVSRLMQRFCQQCSRFHPLQEFDEGKRSCRRRLAGHNRRRRKTQPDAAAARALWLAEEERLSKGGTGLIGSLLNILSQLTGSATLEHVNNPVLDREALYRKAVSASLQDINRTTPLWNQLLPNPNQFLPGYGQQVSQLPTANRQADLALETQRLLSRLASPSPESLLLLLQNSLSAQIAAASMNAQNISGPQVNGGNGLGQGQGTYASTSQIHSDLTIAGLPHSLLPSSFPQMAPTNSQVVRPTSTPPMPLPQLNPVQAAPHSVTSSAERMLSQNPPGTKWPQTKEHLRNGQEATALGQVSIDVGAPSMPPFSRGSDWQSSYRASAHGARPNIDLQQHPVYQISDNSQSGSDEQSPTSSNAHIEWRERTRRISVKLFERTPEDLPTNLRFQIDSWLESLPSDMESYIRPGCLVLTIFVSMPSAGWMELDKDLHASVRKLLSLCSDDFWHKGRILVQVEHQTVFISDGEVQESRNLQRWSFPYIQSVRPLAVEAGESTNITLKGFNLTLPDTRVICAYQGNFLLQDVSAEEHAEADFSSSGSGDDEDTNNNEESVDDPVIARLDSISMCMHPNFTLCGESPITVGRCFMEVEHQIFGANTRPVIVADKDMCSELRKLEEEIDMAAIFTAQTAELQGLEPVEVLGCSEVARLIVEEDITCFLHELGWFFQSSSYWQQGIPASLDMVHAVKLKSLLIFSVERNWCTVVRKLLDVACGHRNIESGVSRLSQVLKDDVSLLHRAVRKKDRCMVELLLAYAPPFLSSENHANSDGLDQFSKVMQFKLQWGNLFRPDMSGPAGLTPLHVAASLQDAEAVVDALTSDPFQVGLHAWLNRRDDNGETPLTCAVACKNFKAVNLVRDKLARLQGTPGEVRNNMLLESLPQSWIQKPAGDLESGTGGSSVQLSVFDNGVRGKKSNAKKVGSSTCRVPSRRGNHFGGIIGPAFRPFLLSLVAIAAVCVCVCIVFKGPPQVRFVLSPFRWEGLDSGPK